MGTTIYQGLGEKQGIGKGRYYIKGGLQKRITDQQDDIKNNKFKDTLTEHLIEATKGTLC